MPDIKNSLSCSNVAAVNVVYDEVGCNSNLSDNGDDVSDSIAGVVLCLPAFVVMHLLFSLLTNILALSVLKVIASCNLAMKRILCGLRFHPQALTPAQLDHLFLFVLQLGLYSFMFLAELCLIVC